MDKHPLIKYHLERAKKIFTKALEDLDRDIFVIPSPSKYNTFNSDQWWKDREDVKRVVMEYLKIFNFYGVSSLNYRDMKCPYGCFFCWVMWKYMV